VFDVDRFTDQMIAAGYARKTCVVYRPPLIRMAAAGVDIDTVGPRELRDYAETVPWSRSSRSLLRSALGCYWKLSGRHDGPLGAIRVPRARTMECRALDVDVAALLAASAAARGDRKGLAVLLGLYAGMRRNEIATLRWSDVGDGWVSIIGKGDRQRVIPLHRVVVDALAGHRAEIRRSGSVSRRRLEYVLPGRSGGPQNPTTVWLWVREVAELAGVGPVATHVLRHTALATSLDNTGDLRAVQSLAGHASPETTAGYTRATRARLVAAVTAIEYA
jgi:integrase